MKPREVEGLDPAAPLRPNAERIVRTRLEELRSLAPAALEPSAATAQHDLRIAAKRLRYVLEITGPCFGPEAKVARDAAKQLQGVLGEIHDCDVMLPRAWGIESLRDPAAHSSRVALPSVQRSLARRGRKGHLDRSGVIHRMFTGLSLQVHTFSVLGGESGGDLNDR